MYCRARIGDAKNQKKGRKQNQQDLEHFKEERQGEGQKRKCLRGTQFWSETLETKGGDS